MPASSKTDPLLAKAEPISDGDSTSGVTQLRREKKPVCSSHKRRVRRCERNNSADTKVCEEGGAGGAPGARAEIPLQQPMGKNLVRQAVPLQPMEVHSGADTHLEPMEDFTLEQVEAPEGGCDPVGSLRWSRLLAGRVAPWREEPRWSRFAGRTCDPMGDPRWSNLFLKNCTPWKRPMLEQFMKNCSPWEGLTLEKLVENCLLWWDPTLEQGKSVRSPPPEEEGVAETPCDELTTAPIPCPPVPLWGRRERNRE
ncbi:hypothetical protein GRJ2_000802800 [Grus japonensis]|uniref:Uncharacterized protein n=1 Tax=Grus japonensis TaxID=30415 RepID=A0ABC9WE13_GRUJA